MLTKEMSNSLLSIRIIPLHLCELDAPLSHKYLGMVDKIGLYGKRIELLYISCGKDVEKFFDTVSTLYYEGVERSKIISMKTATTQDRYCSVIHCFA